MLRLTIIASVILVNLVSLSAHGVQRQKHNDNVAYGIYDGVNLERKWVVIDDQAMSYGADLRVRDLGGNLVTDLRSLRPGSAVKYFGLRDGTGFYVRRIKVIDALPVEVDEEGVSER